MFLISVDPLGSDLGASDRHEKSAPIASHAEGIPSTLTVTSGPWYLDHVCVWVSFVHKVQSNEKLRPESTGLHVISFKLASAQRLT